MKTNVVAILIAFILSTIPSLAQIRNPAVSGTFYPSDPEELKSMLSTFFQKAGAPTLREKPRILICPHAGYIYSGQVAAYSFKEIKNHSYETIILVGPSHVAYFDFASVYNGDCYQTPLGKMPVNKGLAEEITKGAKFIKLSDKGHTFSVLQRGEHCIEVELPFIQYIKGNISIVPIIFGTMKYEVIQELGKRLGEILKKEDVLIVVSSDLSHYHKYEECNRIDKRLIKQLKRMNPKSFYYGLISKDYEACGGAPITSALIAAKKAEINGIKILKHANSGDVPGVPRSQVVGYLAAAMYKTKNEGRMDSKGKNNDLTQGELTKEEQLYLIELAENTIRNVVNGNPRPSPENVPERLKEPRGAFVTIEKNGQLRGCIGYVLPVYPLYQTVIEAATSAALKDPRFPPVSPEELPEITVEISVLTLPRKIKSIDEIEVGKHGLIIKKGFYQGLLLPQVAMEYGWDRETFLEHTCLKAGLYRNAWKDPDTEISIFSAQVFNRETLKEN